MADERLRLVAEVTDGFTGPLGRMQTALRRTSEVGSQGATALRKDFEGVHTALGKTQGVLQGMTPVLSAFGSGAFSAALSVTGVATALRNFAGNTQALSTMSRETGISIDKLRALGALGERFGVSTETMNGAVRNLAKNMYELRQRFGETYSGLQRMNLGELAEQLVSAPNMEAATKRVIEGLGKIRDPEVRRRAAALLGAEELASLAAEVGGQYESVLADIAKRLGKTTQQQVDAAKRFEQTLSELRQNIDGLTHEAMAPLLDKMNEFVKALQSPEAMQTFNGLLGDIAATARTTKQEFEAIVAAWGKLKDYFGRGDPSLNKEFTPGLGGGALSGQSPALPGAGLEGRRASIQQQLELLDRNPSAPDYARKRDRMTEELRRVADELEKLRTQGGATAQKSGFDAPLGGMGALIQRASYGGGGGFGGLGGGGALSGGGGVLSGSRGALSGSGARGNSDGAPVLTGPAPAGSDAGNLTALIEREARRAGIDPRIMQGIRSGESGRRQNGNNPARAYDHNGGTPGRPESSWGPFQLNRLRGLGQQFERETGLDVRDPRTIAAQTRWVAEGLKKHGRRWLSNWMGYHGDRDADPHWGDSGYVPDAAAAADRHQVPARSAPPRGLDGQEGVDLGNGTMKMPDGHIRSITRSPAGSGDAVMKRLYGDQPPGSRAPVSVEGNGTLNVRFENAPPGMRTKSSADGMFKDVNVTKTRQMDTTSI